MRTHYPPTPELELAVVRQEARLPEAEGIELDVPAWMAEVVAELTFQARSSPDVSQASGVSVRMTLANYETLAASALRRALHCGERLAVPRVSDLGALLASTLGKLELEYAGGDKGELEIAEELVRRACKTVFDRRGGADALSGVLEPFEEGWKVEVSHTMPARETLAGLEEMGALHEAAVKLAGSDAPERLASALEFLLEGLHLSNRLNKTQRERGARYSGA